MAKNQQVLNALQRIVEEDGTMSQVFRSFMLLMSNNLPIVGDGTPEGNVSAPQYSLYIDESTPTSPVQYRKMLPEIGGDRTKGWVVV